MPPMPEGVEEGILKGLYRFRDAGDDAVPAVRLLGSGAIMNEVVEAREMLAGRFGVHSEVWAATSYQQLHREAMEAERWNRLHPGEPPRVPWVARLLGDAQDTVVVAASDYSKTLPASISPWVPGPFVALGTDGFGRSDNRVALREYFEVDARHVAWAALEGLARRGRFPEKRLRDAMSSLGIDPDKQAPSSSS